MTTHHPHDTPTTRALLVGWIVAASMLALHRFWVAALDSTDHHRLPDTLATLLAATAVGVAAAVVAHAYRPQKATPPQEDHTNGWLGAFGLASTLPIAMWDGWPTPALLVAAMAASHNAWWTFGFSVFAMALAFGLAHRVSAQLYSGYTRRWQPMAHVAMALGGLGTAVLLVFPILPALRML